MYNTDGSVREHKVLMFVDDKYMEVFLNWLIYYVNICETTDDLDIICLDKTIGQHLQKSFNITCTQTLSFLKLDKDYSTTLNTSPENLGLIWYQRMQILNTYIKKYDVVLSDSDALWLRDPFVDISKQQSESSIISSRAWWPWPLFQEWGSCICMGFFYAKSDDFSSEFFRTLLLELDANNSAVKASSTAANNLPSTTTTATSTTTANTYKSDGQRKGNTDDQVAVNELLKKWGIVWPVKMTVGGSTSVDVGLVQIPTRSGRRRSYHVALLDHERYPRKCHSLALRLDGTSKAANEVRATLRNATVAHCRVPKGSAVKKKHRLRLYGLWQLREDWEAIAREVLVQAATQGLLVSSLDLFTYAFTTVASSGGRGVAGAPSLLQRHPVSFNSSRLGGKSDHHHLIMQQQKQR